MKKIVVLPNRSKDIGMKHTGALLEVLETLPCKVSICEGLTEDTKCDLVIVLGGDASIMRAARCAALLDIPVLSINLGRVGYLAELEPEEVGLVREYFNGNYTVETRMLLEAHLPDGRYALAINDAVISGGGVSRISEIELRSDGSLVSNYRADGVIFSTPTGSTAYSMSAGGPVIDPRLDSICVTPICSLLLKSKPLVFSPDTELELTCTCKREAKQYLTVDGSESYPLEYGDKVRIKRSDIRTSLIRIKKDAFFSVLNDKMSE